MPRLRLPRRFPPTREGWWFLLATLLVGAAAVNGGINLLFFVFGMMIFLILASGVLSELCLRGLEVTRRAPVEHPRRLALPDGDRRAQRQEAAAHVLPGGGGPGRRAPGRSALLLPEAARRPRAGDRLPQRARPARLPRADGVPAVHPVPVRAHPKVAGRRRPGPAAGLPVAGAGARPVPVRQEGAAGAQADEEPQPPGRLLRAARVPLGRRSPGHPLAGVGPARPLLHPRVGGREQQDRGRRAGGRDRGRGAIRRRRSRRRCRWPRPSRCS